MKQKEIINQSEVLSQEKKREREILEIPEETVEEKEGRKAKENINEFAGQAEDFVKIKKQEDKLKKQEMLNIKNRPPLEKQKDKTKMTLETWKNVNRNFFFKEYAVEKLRMTAFRLKGIKNPKKLLYLSRYLETYYSNKEEREIIVDAKELKQKTEEIKKEENKTKEAKRARKKYEKFYGFEIISQDSKPANEKTKIKITRITPFKFKIKDAEKFSKLVSYKTDPVELLETLRDLVYTNELDFQNHFEEIHSLTANNEALDFIKRLKRVSSLQGYYSLNTKIGETSTLEKINEMASSKILNDESEKKLNLFLEISNMQGWRVHLEDLPDFIKISQDENILELAFFLKKLGHNIPHYDMFKSMEALQKEGVIKTLTEKILEFNVDPYAILKKIFASRHAYQQTDSSKKEDIESGCQELKNLAESAESGEYDEKLMQFAYQISVLQEKTIDVESLPLVRSLMENKKEVLALFEMFKKFNVPFNLAEIHDSLSVFLENKENFETIFRPEFQSFLEDMREKLDYKIKWHHLFFNKDKKNYSLKLNLSELFKNNDLKEKLFSEEGVKMIKFLGGFNIEKQRNYETLIDGKVLPFLEKLKEVFLYHYNSNDLNDYSDNFIIQCENDQKLKDILFKKDTEQFYKQLRETFSYEFQFYKLKKYLEFAENEKIKSELFKPETVNFIKLFSDCDIVRDAESLIIIKEGERKIITRLATDLDSKFRVNILNDAFHTLHSVITDKSLQKEVKKEKYDLYKIRVSQNICADFLKYGDAAHELLEKIKEKNWITIQTYNRLYAARRKNIGFESYAYHAKPNENHPTINVTYYGMDFGESRLKNNKEFTVSSYLDDNGFYEGDIGSVKVKIYPETYKIYKEALERYKSGKETEKSFFANFSWYPQPKKYKEEFSQEEFLTNKALPAGPAPNGHSHFYFTPYGIVSGCVSESIQQSDILKKDHPLSKGAWLITGHKEMLLDFLKKSGEILSYEKEMEAIPGEAVTVKIENLDLPKQMEQMILPSNITLGEMILNLHIEQYLHKEVEANEHLLNDIMEQLNSEEITAEANGKILKLDDKIEPDAKVIFKKQFEEAMAA